jgi:hypothetical protein
MSSLTGLLKSRYDMQMSDTTHEISSELYRANAEDCRQHAIRARTPEGTAGWLKIAEEWQKLADEIDAVQANRRKR